MRTNRTISPPRTFPCSEKLIGEVGFQLMLCSITCFANDYFRFRHGKSESGFVLTKCPVCTFNSMLKIFTGPSTGHWKRLFHCCGIRVKETNPDLWQKQVLVLVSTYTSPGFSLPLDYG